MLYIFNIFAPALLKVLQVRFLFQVLVSIVWSFLAAVFIVVVPIVYEIIDLRNAVRHMRSVNPMSWTLERNTVPGKSKAENADPDKEKKRKLSLVKTSQIKINEKKSSSLEDGLIDPNCVQSLNDETEQQINGNSTVM